MKSKSPSILLLLCNWLNAESRGESDKYFTDYFNAVGKLLLPYLARKMPNYQRGDAEDVFQDLMLKHVQQLRTQRPADAAQILFLLEKLSCSGADEIFRRNVMKWRAEMKAWVNAIMAIHAPASTAPIVLEKNVLDTNQKLAELIARGGGFLERLVKEWQPQLACTEVDAAAQDGELEETAIIQLAKVRQIRKEIKQAVDDSGLTSIDKKIGVEGGAQFALNLSELLCLAPGVRLPTVFFLYQMARIRVIDRYRSNHVPLISMEYESGAGEEGTSLLDLDSFSEKRHLLYPDPDPFAAMADAKILHSECEKLLRQPLDEAVRAAKAAPSKQESNRAQARIEKQKTQFAQNCIVLELMLAGMTEDELTSHLSISRDTVRYRKKQIQQLLTPLKNGS